MKTHQNDFIKTIQFQDVQHKSPSFDNIISSDSALINNPTFLHHSHVIRLKNTFQSDTSVNPLNTTLKSSKLNLHPSKKWQKYHVHILSSKLSKHGVQIDKIRDHKVKTLEHFWMSILLPFLARLWGPSLTNKTINSGIYTLISYVQQCWKMFRLSPHLTQWLNRFMIWTFIPLSWNTLSQWIWFQDIG